jgi:hypothetical protein
MYCSTVSSLTGAMVFAENAAIFSSAVSVSTSSVTPNSSCTVLAYWRRVRRCSGVLAVAGALQSSGFSVGAALPALPAGSCARLPEDAGLAAVGCIGPAFEVTRESLIRPVQPIA